MYNTSGDTLAIPYSGSANNVMFLGLVTTSLQNINSETEHFATPNPVQTTCNINFTLAKNQTIEYVLLDINEKIIHSKIFNNLKKGLNSETINVSWIEQGMYILKIKGETLSGQKQLFISK